MSKYTISHRRGEYELNYKDDKGSRRRATLGTSDPRAAELLAPALFAELTKPVGKTVAELWRAYDNDKEGRAIVTPRVTTWKALKGRFAPMQAERVTVEDCRAHMIERRAKGIKDGTLYTELSHLRTTLVWAFKRGLIDKAPYIERPPQPEPRDVYLTKEECRALIAASELPHIRLYILLALSTGARNAALLGVRWSRVDFTRKKIDFKDPDMARGKKRAIVPMNDSLHAALLEAHTKAKTEYVIEWNGQPVKSVKKSLKSAARRAGIAHVSPHVFRHSAAVHMAEADIPMEKIAQFLGHTDVNVTRRIYARYSPTHLRDAADALEL